MDRIAVKHFWRSPNLTTGKTSTQITANQQIFVNKFFKFFFKELYFIADIFLSLSLLASDKLYFKRKNPPFHRT